MRIAVLMSGGVDSSVAAYILKEKGHKVVGVHMVIFDDQDTSRVGNIAKKLQIPLEVMDIRKEFREKVIKYFIDEYKAGRTPNPCYFCNRWIKFGMIFEKLTENFDLVASGHYAIVNDGKLYKAWDKKKDQSYFLSSLKRETLKKIVFPLGRMKKAEVKDIAKDIGIELSEESQDVCFLKGRSLREFFEDEGVTFKKGKFVYKDGKVLGEHEGYFLYTIGQRRGLNVSAGKRVYVKGLDPKENIVYLGDKKDVMHRYMEVENLNFLDDLPENLEAAVKIRSNFNEMLCKVSLENGKALVEFEREAFAVTPGQIAVFYIGDRVVMSGVIKKGLWRG